MQPVDVRFRNADKAKRVKAECRILFKNAARVQAQTQVRSQVILDAAPVIKGELGILAQARIDSARCLVGKNQLGPMPAVT